MNSKNLYLTFLALPCAIFLICILVLIGTFPMVNPWVVVTGIIFGIFSLIAVFNYEDVKRLAESFYED